jgi:hypothetical protein
METVLMDKVAVQDFHPFTEREAPDSRVVKGLGRVDGVDEPMQAEAPMAARAEVPVEVVSKDFILGLLSLAIGRPLVLEGNLGTNVDVKV